MDGKRGGQRLPLLIAGAALALILAWVAVGVLGSDGAEREVATRGPVAPRAEEGGDAALPAAEGPVPTAGSTAEGERTRQPIDAGPDRRREPAWRAEGEQWLEGRVVLPPGTPGDERVIVLAVHGAMQAGALYGGKGPGAEVWATEPSFETAVVSMAEVERDGRFRIALPAAADEAHLALSGRYVFSRRTTAVALPPAAAPELEGELGAWITGRLTPPPGATEEEADLSGAELVLGVDISGGFDPQGIQEEAWEHECETGSDGRFEFRAVNPSIAHAVGVDHHRFAVQLLLGVDVEPGQHLELEIRMRRGATLRGRVVDATGTPLEGVEVGVSLRGIMGRAAGSLRDAETDERGAFELARVPAGDLDLAASREGYRTARQELEREVFDGETVEDIELVLDRGAALAGRVSFPDGAPAEGASVSALLPPSPFGGFDAMTPRRKGAAETDSDGRFEITGLTETKYELAASVEVEDGARAGVWMAREKGVVASGDAVELVLQGIVPLRGRVVDLDGNPVADFEVRATQGGDAMFGMSAEYREWSFADEEGRFEIDDLAPGAWELEVAAVGFGISEPQEVSVPRSDGAPELLFVLELASAIQGFVVDTGGAPAPGAKVTLELDLPARMKAMRAGGIPEARCDQEGRFRLEDLDPGALNLVASLEGFAASEPVACQAASGRVTEDVVLRLRLGGTLTGELYDDEGEPDPGTMVIVQKMPSYTAQHMRTTDADGTFRVEHLEPGNWQVVTSGGFMTGDPDQGSDQDMADFIADMKTEFVEIVDGGEHHVVLGAPAEDPIRFHGRVLHAGEPVTDALVMVMPFDATSLASLAMSPVEEDGSFEFELDRSGSYQVTVQHGAELGQQNNVEYREAIPEGVREHELEIELPLGRISGRVLGPDGKPLADARITLNVDGGVPLGSFLGTRYVDATTDAEGRYDIPFLRPGVYTVGAGGAPLGGVLGGESGGGRVVKSGLRVSEGEWLDSVDFRLKEPGTLTGLVLDEGGSPVPGASIFIRDDEGRLLEHFSMVATDASGRFAYEGIAPGRYTISARSSGKASADSDPVQVPEGGSAEARVTLQPGSLLVVTVVDESGDDVSARLSVRDSGGRELSTMRSMPELMDILEANTGDPLHTIGPVAPGSYELVATTDDGRRARRKVTVGGQPERKIKLRVR